MVLQPSAGDGESLAVITRSARADFVRGAVGMSVALAVAAMLAAAWALLFLHVQVAPVLTGSMRPAFAPGAAVVTRPVPVATVRTGDVLVFRPPGHQDSYAHRVTSVVTRSGAPVITTRGDANPSDDPWRARLTEPTVQRVVYAVPQVGRAMVALHQPRTRSLALVLAGLVGTVLGVRAALGGSGTTLSRPTPTRAG